MLVLKLLWMLLSLLGGLWTATQWTAVLLRFHPQLGLAWVHLGSWRVYAPWQYVRWDVTWSPRLTAWQRRRAQTRTTYGSSRWAIRLEIRQGGLLGPRGVMLGQVARRYLRHEGPEHILVFAPTRSGKGAGLVVPTLLTTPGSVVVHDIKGENWALTAGWRQRFSHVLAFNPTSRHSARYNPLLAIRQGDCEVRDTQNVADILVDPEGAADRRDHWAKTGHALLGGAILHVLYAEPDKTLAGVANFLADPQRSFLDTLDVIMCTQHLGHAVHPVVASAARELLNKAENERSGVLSTAMSFLGVYRDPIVARTTSASDFRLADLQHAAHPVSLYLIVPPSDISRTKPLMRLILNQLGRSLTEDLTTPRRHPLLLLHDEFPAQGRLDFFETALAYIAGYGIRAFLITQSLNQLDKAYGPTNAIMDNCHVRIAFAPNDERTARRITDLLGTATEQRQQQSYTGPRWSLLFDRTTVSSQETGRPLLTPGEIMQLPATDEVLLVAGVPPIRAQKIRYFADRALRRRLWPAPAATAPPDRPLLQAAPWVAEGPKPLAPAPRRGTPTPRAVTAAAEDEKAPELPEASEDLALVPAPLAWPPKAADDEDAAAWDAAAWAEELPL